MDDRTQGLVISVAREVFVRRAATENPRESVAYALDAAEQFVRGVRDWQRASVNRKLGARRD